MHPNNRHPGRYDFNRLIAAEPALAPFVSPNAHGDLSVNFADPAAVKALNRALLKDSYGISNWDIPADHLCPPVPGRADALHYLGELLADKNGGVVPRTAAMNVLDIGTGANCIYPLIGAVEFGWQFVGTDINATSLANAQAIVDANPALTGKITLRLQTTPNAIFKGIVQDGEWFDLTVCNPPFHASPAEASAGSARKWRNLGKAGEDEAHTPALNFGGHGAELWCPGGEVGFITRMVKESAQLPTCCFWFSALVSKSTSLPAIEAALDQAKALERRTINIRHGQKTSRIIAWTYLTPAQQKAWRKLRW